MSNLRFLERYKDMERLSRDMLNAASQADWDTLVALEQSRTSIEQELKLVDTLSWQGAHGLQKRMLLESILAIDADTRALADSGMKGLQAQLGSIDTGKKLKKTYGLP
ncbi:flagellar protein FliT [Noviherbaspirillum saxi]|uniref:Flagellar protein FliT n=1 Tax=Noviherbaspirillum saxi TaxID=2320863 RepID=A0A3A3FQW9_9BURK|nr:flagellar protein FliT [Noviherbaspirillum saxi]RJF98612.1 flagellar protein FliT [Noviherbaspirillum saxi]